MSGSGSITSGPGRVATARGRSYVGLVALALAGCTPRPPAVVPSQGFEPATRSALSEAARRLVPAGHEIVRFGWRSDDGRLMLSGQGATRLAPPDSMRVDIAASLGVGRATIIMTGDSAQAQPADVVDRILPDRFALWVALGFIRIPDGAERVERLADGGRTLWRVTDALGRITVFDTRGDTLVGATREENGRTTSVLQLTRDRGGHVTRARLTDYGRALRLEVDITGREASEAFAPDLWRLRP